MRSERTSTQAWLRPRGHRELRRPRRHLRLGPGFAGGPLPSLASGPSPSLGIPEPDTRLSAIISGSLSLGAHLLIVAFLALSAWLAPDVVEELIPVQIIHDAPEAAPPPRRVVIPRRAIARTRVATSIPRPTPVARPAVQPVATRAVQQANIRATAAPTQLTQRQVTSQRVVAQRTLSSPTSLSVARVPLATVAATDLSAPAIDVTGPREVALGAAIDVTAPQAFADYTTSGDTQYTAAAAVTASGVAVPVGDTGFAIDAELVDGASLYGTPGGTGTAVPGTPCTGRISVKRYYGKVRERTLAEWSNFELPDGIDDDARVVLHFVLDESGSASSVSVVDAPSEALGDSCKQALLAAAPFASMDEDVRCLAGTKLRGTFTIPVERAP